MSTTGKKKFLSDFFFVLAANAVVGLRPVVLIAVVTRHFGQEGYGLWSQVLTTALFLSPLIMLRLPNALTRFLAGSQKAGELAGSLLAALSITVTLGGTVVIAGTLASQSVARLLFGEDRFAALVLPALIYALSFATFAVANGYLLIRQKQKAYALSLLVKEVTEIGLIVLLANRFELHDVLFAASAPAVALTAAILLYALRHHGLVRPRLPLNRDFVSFAGWLIITHVAFFWAGRGSRYILVDIGGIEELSIFAVVYAVVNILGLLVASNRLALLPAVSAHWNAGQAAETRPLVSLAYNVLFLLGLPLLAFLFVYGPALVELLSGRQMATPAWLFPLLGLVPLAEGVKQVAALALWMEKKLPLSLAIHVLGMVVNLGLALVLIGPLGVTGAAIGAVVSMLLMTVLIYRISLRIFRVGISWNHALKCLACSLVLAVFFTLYRQLPLPQLVGLVSSAIIGLVVYGVMTISVKAVPIAQIKGAVLAVKKRLTGGSDPARNDGEAMPDDEPPATDRERGLS